MKRVHLVISGRVQGVFYRQSAMDLAQSIGLDGWVRNRLDGTVEAVAQGTGDEVERFVAWCHQGPNLAQVNGVDRTDAEAVSMPGGCNVRPTA